MPGPWAVQNLQMPHPRDWQGVQMPLSSLGGGGGRLGAGGIDWYIIVLKIITIIYYLTKNKIKHNNNKKKTILGEKIWKGNLIRKKNSVHKKEIKLFPIHLRNNKFISFSFGEKLIS